MKKINLIIIALFAVAMCYGQQIVRPSIEYYSADSLRNRSDINRASADAVNKWRESGFIEMEVKLYQPTLIYRFPKVETGIVNLDKTYKDTLVKGWSKIRLNKLRKIVFTEAGGIHKSYNLKVLDTTIFRPCPMTDFCERDTLTYFVRKHYEGKYLIDVEEINDFEFLEYDQVSQDVNETYTQTYANKVWGFYYKQADTVEQLNLKSYTNPSNSPGTDEQGRFRHSFTFDKKYFQIKLIDVVTGYPIELDIQNNEFK